MAIIYALFFVFFAQIFHKIRAQLIVLGLTINFEGDSALFNPYHVIAVNLAKHPHVKYDLAKKHIDFVVSEQGQKIIAEFKKGGQQLFYPDAMETK